MKRQASSISCAAVAVYCVLELASSEAVPRAQEPAAWRDPSKHQVTFVTVDEGVQLEVLDWGGSARALVLLAGSGLTAHVFDDFAPKLTDCCHVYGITRRGFGASSQPPTGYGDQRLADDVVQVLNAVHIQKPVLAGHSMAGGELTTVANQHSDLLSGLVYLDALADPRDAPDSDARFKALLEKVPKAPPPSCMQDRSSFTVYRAFLQCQMKLAFPEAEVRNTYFTNPNGTVDGYKTPQNVFTAIGEGQKKRDYSNVRVPVLALFEFPRTRLDQLRPDEPQPRNDEERQALLEAGALFKTFVDRWAANLKKSVPDARIVDLPAAGHYVFMTREADVLTEMHKFVASLK